MRRSLLVATIAGAAVTAGLFATPAFAATDTTPGSTACPMAGASAGASAGTQARAGGRGGGMGPGAGHGRGAELGAGQGAGQGAGMGAGRGAELGAGQGAGMGRQGGTATDPLAGLTQGTLTDTQKQTLAGMAEEEKLAHDVYVALARTTGDARFTRIAAAETRHLTAVRALLTRYSVTDPTAGKGDGVFATASVQQQYTDLVARGSASLAAALAVGRDVENADVRDLAKAGTGVTAPDVQAVYTRLADGSRRHLRAFGG